MLQDIIDKNQEYIDDVKTWSDEQYNKYFAKYFETQNKLSAKFQHTSHIDLTDEELTDVLTKIPLDLVQAASQLAEFKTFQEVVKMRIKQQQAQYIAVNSVGNYSAAQLKQEAADSVIEDKLLVTVYDTIIEKVERQISYSKELIMGCKKIWDGRRNTEGPVLGIDGSENKLSEYDFSKNQKPSVYVK